MNDLSLSGYFTSKSVFGQHFMTQSIWISKIIAWKVTNIDPCLIADVVTCDTWPHLQQPPPLTVSLTARICIYHALVQLLLLYAAETWTVLSVDSRALEAFHMKCQQQLLQIIMASIYPEWWDLRDHQSAVHLRDHQLSSQCPLRPRGHAAKRLTRHSTAKSTYR